jgi:hypothetical protein
MIANLQPYPEYKECGSRWLARVPAHWEVRNLRTLIRPRNERNRTDLPLLSVACEKGVFVRSLKALAKVMLTLLKDDTQVHRQFVENESFRRFVTDMVFTITSE